MSLAEDVRDAYVALIGNRITLASAIVFDLSISKFILNITEMEKHSSETTAGLLFTALFGVAFLQSTKCGIGTAEFYNATNDHIRRKGTLQEHVVKKWIEKAVEKDSALGYCQLQGIYLAAKKHGMEELFFEYKKKYSVNRLPNF